MKKTCRLLSLFLSVIILLPSYATAESTETLSPVVTYGTIDCYTEPHNYDAVDLTNHKNLAYNGISRFSSVYSDGSSINQPCSFESVANTLERITDGKWDSNGLILPGNNSEKWMNDQNIGTVEYRYTINLNTDDASVSSIDIVTGRCSSDWNWKTECSFSDYEIYIGYDFDSLFDSEPIFRVSGANGFVHRITLNSTAYGNIIGIRLTDYGSEKKRGDVNSPGPTLNEVAV